MKYINYKISLFILVLILVEGCKKDNNTNIQNDSQIRVKTYIDSFIDGSAWIIDTIKLTYDENSEFKELNNIINEDNVISTGRYIVKYNTNSVDFYSDFISLDNLDFYLNLNSNKYLVSDKDGNEYTYDSRNRLIYLKFIDEGNIVSMDTIIWNDFNIDKIVGSYSSSDDPSEINTFIETFEYDTNIKNTVNNFNFGMPYFGWGTASLLFSFVSESTKDLCIQKSRIDRYYSSGIQTDQDTIITKYNYTVDSENRVTSKRTFIQQKSVYDRPYLFRSEKYFYY